MVKEFILKTSPLQKIEVGEKSFRIVNHQYEDENGVFTFSKLREIGFTERQTDYLSTLAIFLISLIVPASILKTMKTNEKIRLNYDGKEIHFPLFNFNKEAMTAAIFEIQKRINTDK